MAWQLEERAEGENGCRSRHAHIHTHTYTRTHTAANTIELTAATSRHLAIRRRASSFRRLALGVRMASAAGDRRVAPSGGSRRPLPCGLGLTVAHARGSIAIVLTLVPRFLLERVSYREGKGQVRGHAPPPWCDGCKRRHRSRPLALSRMLAAPQTTNARAPRPS